ncbi:hypothetical protein [Nocardia fluminea]|uniref:hypothetical protein n=1 Tax=Nocardia fluminea TaxID=134984 RepID=UPI00365738D0
MSFRSNDEEIPVIDQVISTATALGLIVLGFATEQVLARVWSRARNRVQQSYTRRHRRKSE